MQKEFDLSFNNGSVKFNYMNVLWQGFTKDDLDQQNKLTDQDWIDFVHNYNDSFAERTNKIARSLFELNLKKSKAKGASN